MRKSLKNGIWTGLGLLLGGVWGGFWEGFGGFGSLLGFFLVSFFHAFIWDGLPKGSWRLLGSILARFEGVWKDFGRVWRGFWEGFWRVLANSGLCWV